jgi:hypothetical protein
LGFVAAAFALVPQAMSSVVLDTERYYGAGADNFRPSANTLFVDGFGVWNLNTVFSLAVVVTAALGLVAYWVLPVTLRRRRSERLMVVAVVAGVVATTGISGPVWDLLPVVSKLQFPWRITALLTFVCAVLVGRADARRAWIMVLVVAAAAVPFSSWDRTAPVEAFVAPRPSLSAPGTVFPDPIAAWQAGSGGWYWRHEKLVEPWLVPKTQHPLLLEELSGQPVAQFDSIRGRPAAVSGGSESSIRVVRWGQTERELEVDLDAGGSLVWRVIPFPDMPLRLDGSPVPGFVDSETGLLAQNVPAGRHRVTWSWSPPPAFRAARIVSMLAVLVVACLAVAGWRLGSLQRRVDRV